MASSRLVEYGGHAAPLQHVDETAQIKNQNYIKRYGEDMYRYEEDKQHVQQQADRDDNQAELVFDQHREEQGGEQHYGKGEVDSECEYVACGELRRRRFVRFYSKFWNGPFRMVTFYW